MGCAHRRFGNFRLVRFAIINWQFKIARFDNERRPTCFPLQIEIHEMSFSLHLDDEQSARLEERARELGVDARELAKAAVNDLLTRPADDFDRAAKFVLDKNRELYRRLS